jgi:hypothetical protein
MVVSVFSEALNPERECFDTVSLSLVAGCRLRDFVVYLKKRQLDHVCEIGVTGVFSQGIRRELKP